MREAMTRYVVLGAIDALGASSGYDIRQFIERSVGNFWRESFGQIYPELKKLSDEGLIESADKHVGPREKRRFRITRKGIAALSAWIAQPPKRERPRSELLLKLFFGKFASVAASRVTIEAAQQNYMRARAIADAGVDQIMTEDAADPGLVYFLMVADAGRVILQARVCWAERAKTLLDAFEAGGNTRVIKEMKRLKGKK
jgi:DNA-binding PadR family transcriptional regulator